MDEQNQPQADTSTEQQLTPANAELTFGGKAVGLTFNPSSDPNVQKLKAAYADIIDHLNNTRTLSTDPDVTRLCSIAITEAQGAQMWAVKAVTWGN